MQGVVCDVQFCVATDFYFKAQKPELNVKKLRSVDTAREEKRNQLFAEQESKLASRQRKMRRVQRREQQERLKTMEEKKLMRERNEIRQEAEREHRQLSRLQREHQVSPSLCQSYNIL